MATGDKNPCPPSLKEEAVNNGEEVNVFRGAGPKKGGTEGRDGETAGAGAGAAGRGAS